MSAPTIDPTDTPTQAGAIGSGSAPSGDGKRKSPVAMVAVPILCLIWTIPTLGLLVNSFRTRDDALASGWWNVIGESLTLDNYDRVFNGTNLGSGFVNSIIVGIPATILPIMFAAFAAYAFTFMQFKGRDVLFVVVVAVLVVPIQVAFQPMLNLLGGNGLNITGQFAAAWLLHTGFGMPLCIYTLRNYMATLPKTVIESAKIDGASHYQTFWKLIVPMSTPALAAFAILQFMWVWNDLLIAKLFLTDNPTVIVELQGLLGTQGQGTELLTAGAFISMIVPMVVFFSLQRFFVRGLTSGAVKG